MQRRKVIGSAGMPGAGKATVLKIGRKLGYRAVVMGDVIREETVKRGLHPTAKNLGKVMLRIRKEEGSTAVAKRCCDAISENTEQPIIIDGLRSLSEVQEFKKHFLKVKVLAIHASPKTRFQRLLKRNRSDVPFSWEDFLDRDLRELHLGLGNVIALADVLILNETGKMAFRRNVTRFLEREKNIR
ncbi:MAG: flagellar hook-basal body complex protein FliE [Candidatus Bathyarchaeota archaeon]|nr:MAG: flagellar hook-basal body complex protein FliE [Candidatus Bathyarchaeota archaeon]